MIYYNGFNLLVDILVGISVWFFTFKYAWWAGYHAGIEDNWKGSDYDEL